ncbi:uncharacterized protein BT62DRAFT_999198 [Guyanagaster necrorhizus]|uniref:Uncharacterized protein n=1 Tax=Guyanagaster necrorhizus TaxID=856835 RepID=A0A9P7W736_9AGAR|nr:uncharacterized protein BT62DRAFT_999198 [Guyanagaster necrorhizus MCA 3950]KAG7453165.1 hypothetical protein BT62DRAFT_999198 [Guyanagaster necrorhizus MCA 3950]
MSRPKFNHIRRPHGFRLKTPLAWGPSALDYESKVAAVDSTSSPWNRYVTGDVFRDFNKIYNTVDGAAAFGVHSQGGEFLESFYLAADQSGNPGTLFRYVNCAPFGYINDTYLVGVADQYNNPILVNNPFFGLSPAKCTMTTRDLLFWPVTAYTMACGGPHLGNEDAAGYLASSIDTLTILYINSQPGNIHNIAIYPGVTSIDRFYSASPMALERHTESASKAVSTLLNLSTIETPGAVSYINWAHAPEWISNVLDGHWDVNTDRSLEELWARGTLEEFGQYSLQYANDVAAGRVVIVADNVLVDINGMSSSTALENYARKLLGHTIHRNRPPLAMPVIRYGPKTIVQGVDTRFLLYFELNKNIAAAAASPEGTGILFDNYVLKEGLEASTAHSNLSFDVLLAPCTIWVKRMQLSLQMIVKAAIPWEKNFVEPRCAFGLA